MTVLFVVGCAVTVLGTAGLLVAESKGPQRGTWATKPVASTGFLVAAVGAGALETAPGRVVVLGLALSMAGDVALIGRSRPAFLAGLGAFLLGHVAFAVAFALRTVEPTAALLGLLAVGFASVVVWRWVSPHVDGAMRAPVAAYVLVISAMVATAAGAVSSAHGVLGLVGAVMFYGSDLAVARDRFVAPGFANRAWGLPLYYAAQLVFAASAGS
jgi:uncharacterized membrane protein YhhN